MFCKNCGKKLNQGEIFCTNCGTRCEYQTTIINNNSNSQQQIYSDKYMKPNQINNNLNNKKINIGMIIVGILGTIGIIIGSVLTISTFFYFGPFIGFIFLIPGSLLLFSALFSKVKMTLRIILTIISTIALCTLVIIISVLLWSNLF